MIRLIALLGNPGSRYARTRHNVPWLLVDNCALFDGCKWQSKFHGTIATIVGGVRAIRPQTFMNQSGRSVTAAMQFYGFELDELLVVHDEVELPFGTVSFKDGGGTAGHNGLRSVRRQLGSGRFYRYRIGVSRPTVGTVSSHVLSRFSQHEEARLLDYLGGACRLLAEFLDAPDPADGCRKGKIEVLPE